MVTKTVWKWEKVPKIQMMQNYYATGTYLKVKDTSVPGPKTVHVHAQARKHGGPAQEAALLT